jgi:hypothetical protein
MGGPDKKGGGGWPPPLVAATLAPVALPAALLIALAVAGLLRLNPTM